MKRLHKQYHYYGQSFTTIAALLVVAVIGAYLLISTHAATPYGSVETETGTLTTGAAVQPETNASNGSDVQFGQTTNTNPGLGTFLACPSGAVQVSTGSIPSFQPNTNYCFAKGTYSHFSTTPQTGDGFYGQGNAVLDGGSSTSQAFNSAETHIISGVTIDGFTMQNYSDPGGQPYAVVEVNGGSNVTLSNNTFNDDNTTAISFGGHDGNVPCCGPEYDYSVQNSLVTHNVIENIGYSGINISGSWGGTTVSYNAVSNTDTERIDPEIDVAAIGKFANNDGLIVKGNTTSNNYDIGMWFDDYNVGSTIEDNTFTNDRVGLMYEISFNATISNNTFSTNGTNWDEGGAAAGVPGAAIRVSASGAVSENFPSGYSHPTDGPNGISISSNTFTNNLEGVYIYNGHGTGEPANNISVTGNTVTGSSSGHADSYAMASADGSSQNVTFSNNTYILYQSLFADLGGTSWSGWKGAGFDTNGSTCKTESGGSC
jgi:parallel beta-helix repeat protein